MASHSISTVVCAILMTASPISAQPQRAPQPAPAVAPAPKLSPDAAPQKAVPVKTAGQPVNVKVEFTLTDQRGGSPPIKRTVSVLVADGDGGFIRSQSEVVAVGNVPLNVDVQPQILPNAKIKLRFTLQYDWPAGLDGPSANPSGPPPRGTVMKTNLQQSISVIVEDGKSIVAAQSADPIGDRTVTVEVKASLMK